MLANSPLLQRLIDGDKSLTRIEVVRALKKEDAIPRTAKGIAMFALNSMTDEQFAEVIGSASSFIDGAKDLRGNDLREYLVSKGIPESGVQIIMQLANAESK